MTEFFASKRVALLVLAALLTACGEETESESAAAGSANMPPEISGEPAKTVMAGTTYSFQPEVMDPESDPLVFGIDGMPAWMQFDTASGLLTGTPGTQHRGSHKGIVVWVTDGENQTLLPAFDLDVVTEADSANSAPAISGSAPAAVLAGSAYAFTPTSSDPDGDTLVFAVQNLPDWASFNSALGRIEGTPDLAQAGLYENIVITVSDGSRSTALAPFNIVVTVPNVNTPPTISGTPPGFVLQGTSYVFQPAANDADGDSLTFSIVNRPAWTSFNTSTGRLSGTPGAGQVNNFTSIEISVSDGAAVATLPAFNITVTASNAPPTISGNPSTVVLENQGYLFQPSASDADGDSLVFSVTGLPSWASFDTSTGRLSGTPDAGDVGTFTNIAVTVSDGAAAANLAPFSITVMAVNDPPTISGTPATSVAEGVAYSFQPTATDPDGDSLTFSISNRPTWATFTASTGRLAGTPGPSHVGTSGNIVIRVSDGTATVSLPAFSIAVAGTNDAPTISGTPPATIGQGVAYSFQPTATDPDGDTLTYSIANRPSWAAFNNTTGRLSGTPGAGSVGTHANIVISVSDGVASSSLAAFSIVVVAVNAAPSISGTPPGSILQGVSYSFAPTASDPNGDALIFSIANRPGWASFNTSTGRLSGTPTAANVGTYSNIAISVSDGAFSTSLPAFSIVVTAPNSAPSISGSPATSVNESAAYSFVPTASDPDGDPLTFSIVSKPGWASFNTSTGRLSGTPSSGNVGTYANIVIRVSDGTVTASLPGFAIAVLAVNSAPVISGTPSTSVMQGNAYAFTPTTSDPNGDSLTFSIANKPAWASFNTSTGALQGTPSAGDVGNYSNITISVSDGSASASLPTFSLTVDAIAMGSATLSWVAPAQNVDGSPLNDLAGYKLYWGTSPGVYTDSVTLNNPGITTYLVENLGSGTHYFAARAFNAADEESALSNETSKTIP
jgi:hypothetical protein